jgi:hypothetical protein
MTLRNRGEPAGFGRIAAPAMAAAMRRVNRKDLANLKRIMERLARPRCELRRGPIRAQRPGRHPDPRTGHSGPRRLPS